MTSKGSLQVYVHSADCAAGSPMDLAATPLLTDLYQLNMIQAYLEHGRSINAWHEQEADRGTRYVIEDGR